MNDASPDDGRAVVMEIVGCDPPVVVIDLSRNFGRHKAIMRGLDEARVLGEDLEQSNSCVFGYCLSPNEVRLDGGCRMGLRGMQGTQGNFDLIVVGNGAIGCAVAFELQRRNSGLKIALVGPNSRQGSASASGGNLIFRARCRNSQKPMVRRKFDLAP